MLQVRSVCHASRHLRASVNVRYNVRYIELGVRYSVRYIFASLTRTTRYQVSDHFMVFLIPHTAYLYEYCMDLNIRSLI